MSSDLRRHVLQSVAGVALLVGGGTVGFHELLNEAWHNAFYRTCVTVTLTGLDTTPGTTGAQFLTIGLALGGVAIFGYLVAQAVEAITREVMGEARREKQ